MACKWICGYMADDGDLACFLSPSYSDAAEVLLSLLCDLAETDLVEAPEAGVALSELIFIEDEPFAWPVGDGRFFLLPAQVIDLESVS